MKLGKSGQGALNPAIIMSVVVTLIILAVGTYAFFVTQAAIPIKTPAQTTTAFENSSYYAVQNVTGIGNQVFNIVGTVLVIGAIMLIVGMVYSYMKPQ